MITLLRFPSHRGVSAPRAWLIWLLLLALIHSQPGQAAPFLRGVPRQQLVAGTAHSLFLQANGTLLAWGDNTYGQLGDGTTTAHSAPTAVTLPVGRRFVQVATGSNHSLALTTDGLVYAWGSNDVGQLGNGTTTNGSTPAGVVLPGGKPIVAVAAGQGHSLALAADGTLYAWGGNGNGQLGDNTTTNRLTPVAVALPAGKLFKHLAAGGYHTLAVTADGLLYTWGDNAYGQLGNGGGTSSTVPVAVLPGAAPSAARFVHLAAGQYHSLAQAADGTVYAWGNNARGQLGDNSTTNRATPVAVAMPTGKLSVQLAAGSLHTLMLTADGLSYAWGNNADGEFGNGTTTNSSVPVAVSVSKRSVQLAAGDSHALALASDGTLSAWGGNGSGQLGDGTTTSRFFSIAISVSPATGYVQVAAGGRFSLGLLANGAVKAWGQNNYGQLGNNATNNLTTNVTAVGVVMPTGKRFVQIAAGEDFGIGLADDGTVYAWGNNSQFQLGNGTQTNSLVPVPVTMPAGKLFVSVSAGVSYGQALTADGLVYGWGLSGYGQLGLFGTRNVPTAVPAPAGKLFVQALGGENHLVALVADGTAYAWGNNNKGQLGAATGGTTYSTTAVAVTMPTGKLFSSLGVGGSHSLAVTADGLVYGWGSNDNNQLGNGSSTDSNSNSSVSLTAVGLTNVVQVAGGLFHSLALKADGSLYGWGYNGNGQLGSLKASYTSSNVPLRERTNGTRWSTVANGSRAQHSLTIGPNDGTGAAGIPSGAVFSAGLNDYSQLGDNTRTESDIFVRNTAPLPVELTTFLAEAAGLAAHLSWTTASERNSAYFQVERSSDGRVFTSLAQVAAQGTSTSPTQYSFTDEHPSSATVYYRLRQVDRDNSFSFSPVRALTRAPVMAPALVLYPNPARTAVTVAAGAIGAPVRVFDQLGRCVATATTDATGTARLALPEGLRAGLYMVRCEAASHPLVIE